MTVSNCSHTLNAIIGIISKRLGSIIPSKPLPWKQKRLIIVPSSTKFISFKLTQFVKDRLVTDPGISTFSNLSQFLISSSVNVFGKIILSKFSQPEIASSPTISTPSGIIISFTVEFPSNIPSKVVLNKIPPIFSSPPNFLTFKNDIVWGIFTTSFGFSIPINVAVPLKKSPSNVNPSLLCFPLILKYAIVNTTTHRPKTKAIMLEIIFVFGIISLPIL